VTAGAAGLPPLKRVVASELMPGWWNAMARRPEWFLTPECGHHCVRTAARAPARIRCGTCWVAGASASGKGRAR